MVLRTTFLISVLALTHAHAEHMNSLGRGAGNFGQQQQQQQQPSQQQQQQMGGMGGGMGGGGGAQYESKREEIQKALEQPAQEGRKAMMENTKQFTTEVKAMLQETTKAIQAGMAKDEKLDEKTTAALSAAPASNSKAMTESANDIIANIETLSKTQAALVMRQAETAVAAMNNTTALAPTTPATLGERIQLASSGRASGSGLASVQRAPAATANPTSAPTSSGALTLGGNPVPVTDPKAFRRGLLHNPPGSVSID